MKRIINFAIITLLLAGIYSCMPREAATTEEAANEEIRKQPVRVMTLSREEIANTEKLTASINAYEETYLAPAISGRIRDVKVDVNDRVSMGEILVEMDKTQLEQTRVQYQNLRKDLERMDTLLQYGSITEQAYDQLKTQIEVSEVLLENLEENTELRAPYTGIITGKYYNDGELFSPTPNTPAGKSAIISMVRMDILKVYVNLSEKLLPEIKKGIKAQISTDVYPGEKFTGSVYRIYPTIDPVSRTFRVELHLPNQAERLRPGMFARVSIELGQKEAIIVPAIAIIYQSGTNERYIFINDDGIARKIRVVLGERFDDKIEIISNEIKGGEPLIFAGQKNLMDGQPVEVISN